MTTYGVTATGFVLKPLDVIKSEIESDILGTVGPSVNVQADSLTGNLIGIFAGKVSELWEVAQGVYASEYPDSAAGASLDGVASITGTEREPATKSAVNVTCTGTPGTVLGAGRVLSVVGSGARFASVGGAVIGGGGTVVVAFQAQATGPVIANAHTLTHIETPVSGWTSATNPLDAIVGTNVEDDEDFRGRRTILVSGSGSANVDAIRAALLKVVGVTQAFVFENTTDAIVDTLPPHSVECLVSGGVDADIRAAIFVACAAGIQAFGSTTGTVNDSEGTPHEIDFTRPTNEVLHIQLTVLTNAAFPVTGAQIIKDSLAAWALLNFDIGQDVIRNRLFEPVFRDFSQPGQPEIPGIEDVTDLEIKFGGAFATANLVVTARQIATLDTSNIAVTVT